MSTIRAIFADIPITLNAPAQLNVGNNEAGTFLEIEDAAHGKHVRCIVSPDVLLGFALNSLKMLAVLEYLQQQEAAKKIQLPNLNGMRNG